MSLDLFLFLAGDAPLNTDRLNEAAQKFNPIAVYERNVDLGTHSGFLPVILDGRETGVETYKISYSELAEYLPPNEDIDPENTIVIQFRWGGDANEGATALYTAALYSATYQGVAFDPMSNMYLGADQLMQGFEAFFNLGSR
ncbi:hypothetical protein ACFSJ3_15970 [Corallincola platygyrae]|uniref:Uncharacterized protein n=1 Tax=Corallincola platygyrae TaxID=1193278 RepID=A0ABW4XSN8_9GAMM